MMTTTHVTHGLQALVSRVDRRLGRKWQLEILATGLAFNMLSVKAFGQGLLDFSDASRAVLTGPNAAVTLAAFVVATYIVPQLGAAFVWLLEQIEHLQPDDRGFDGRSSPLERGWVRIAQAREAALLERDTFWTERVDQEVTARDRHRAARRRLERQAFALLFLLVVDLACPQSLAIGLLQLITGIDFARELLVVLYLAAALRWCIAVLRNPIPNLGMIYHPALARHLGAKAKHFSATARSR
jgi:hypothetical protein